MNETTAILTEEESAALIRHIAAKQQRTLSDEVIQQLIQKSAEEDELYLRLLVQRILIINPDHYGILSDGTDGLSVHQRNTITTAPVSTHALFAELLTAVGNRAELSALPAAAILIAHSRKGLRCSDLQALLPDRFRGEDFHRLTTYLSECFITTDENCCDFSSPELRACLLDSTPAPTDFHTMLHKHFAALDSSDPLRSSELPYHLLQAKNIDGFRQYVITLTSDQELCSAADSLRDHTLTQGPDLIRQLLEGTVPDKNALPLLRLMDVHFFPQLPVTDDNRRMLQRICLLYKNLAVAVHERMNTEISGQAALRACDLYATLHDTSTPLGRISILNARSKAAEIMEKLAESRSSKQVRITLSDTYRSLGDFYATATDDTSIRRAMDYYERALHICHGLHEEQPAPDIAEKLAECYRTLAVYLVKPFFHPDSDKEVTSWHILTAERLLKQASTLTDSPEIWGSMAGLNLHCRGLSRREQAMDTLRKQEDLLRSAYAAQPTIPVMQALAQCLMDLADLHTITDKAKDAVTAYHLYKEAADLRLELMNSLRSRSSGMDYAQARYGMAQMLWRVGGEKNYNAALGYMEINYKFLQHQHNPPETDHSALMQQYDLLMYALEDKLWLPHPEHRRTLQSNPAYDHAYACAELLEIMDTVQPELAAKLTSVQLIRLHRDALPTYRRHLQGDVPLENQYIRFRTEEMLNQINQ